MTYALLYLLGCFLQPICLPIPETLTVLLGSRYLGAAGATVLGIIGTISGIMFMYWITSSNGGKMVKRIQNSDKMDQYRNYVRKHETLIIGLLFIIPVLPDEIVSVGAGLTRVNKKRFFIIATMSKMVSISMIAYASWFAKYLYLSQYEVIGIELIILFLEAGVMKFTHKEKGVHGARKETYQMVSE